MCLFPSPAHFFFFPHIFHYDTTHTHTYIPNTLLLLCLLHMLARQGQGSRMYTPTDMCYDVIHSSRADVAEQIGRQDAGPGKATSRSSRRRLLVAPRILPMTYWRGRVICPVHWTACALGACAPPRGTRSRRCIASLFLGLEIVLAVE